MKLTRLRRMLLTGHGVIELGSAVAPHARNHREECSDQLVLKRDSLKSALYWKETKHCCVI